MRTIREIDPFQETEFTQVQFLLSSAGLRKPENIDYTAGLFEEDSLIATGSISNDILKGIAVAQSRRGEDLSAVIMTHLLKRALERGIEYPLLFTHPDEAFHFEELGFRRIAAGAGAALLQWGEGEIEAYKANLRHIARDTPSGASCIVMNANPFTLGHRYLVERAAEESSWLYVLVVAEARSSFPPKIRLELVREGVADLKKVTVLSGGRYTVSSATFPSYFTGNDILAEVHAELDLAVFASHIAPSLKITRRYVGNEPFCSVTNTYNRCMRLKLPSQGIDVRTLERLESGGSPISASTVRRLIREGRIEDTERLLPPSTYRFLRSDRGAGIILRIGAAHCRH